MDKGCLIGHSAIHDAKDCEKNSLKALRKAAVQLNLTDARSAKYPWCDRGGQGDQVNSIFYGNFFALSTKLLLDPEIRALSRYLFDSWESGYFTYRWGDQAPFAIYVCHALDIPDLHNDPKICDYSEYRGTVFEHYQLVKKHIHLE